MADGIFSQVKPAVEVDEELKLRIDDTDYVLVEHATFAIVNTDSPNPYLFLVYAVEPGQTISQSGLRKFRTEILDRDDVFHPFSAETFCSMAVTSKTFASSLAPRTS